MNYRHAFHAGNFADCMKHALLVWLLEALRIKPAPIFVLDTHAGAGSYDLDSGPAQRTGEWRDGIGRLLENPPAPLNAYVTLVKRLGLYPGSPALIRAMLRPADRLACCELHVEEATVLRRRFGASRTIAVHHRDGWEALGGLLPPKERRGLILIDPPYEDTAAFSKLVSGLALGHSRFRTGVFVAWYPIKHRAPVRAFHTALTGTGIRDIVAAELLLREPLDPTRLNGCGLLVMNPPYRFEAAALTILQALAGRLTGHDEGRSAEVIRLAEE